MTVVVSYADNPSLVWPDTNGVSTWMRTATGGVIGFDLTTGTSASGVWWANAVNTSASAAAQDARADFARTGEVIDYLSTTFGRYPFTETGNVAPAAVIGFAAETQTRPVSPEDAWANGSNMEILVHEQAHQWAGDWLTVRDWRHTWLNEGFATCATWLWNEDHGGPSAQALLKSCYQSLTPESFWFWGTPIGNPGTGFEFSAATYTRGAMTLQALRNNIGDDRFFRVLRLWTEYNAVGTVTTEQFIDLAQRQSGTDLTTFFATWLYSQGKPDPNAANGLSGVWDPDPAGARGVRASGHDTIAATRARLDRIPR